MSVIQRIGIGAINQDVATTTLGTSGIVSTSLNKYHENTEGRLQLFFNAIPDKWIAMDVTLAAGGSLRWLTDALGGLKVKLSRWLSESAYEMLSREANNSPAGSNGLIFLSDLPGERCLHPDPNAKGEYSQ